MKRASILTIILILVISAQVKSQELTALEVLRKSDSVVNAPKDQDMKIKFILIDKDGGQKEREAIMLQKGSEIRMVKFLSPADQQGIAFLDLPDDMMYLYLPAFRKVRRIASHVKNQKFAGTDLTYDDMATINYAEEYDPEFAENTDEHFVLVLTPKAGVKKDYSKLTMRVRKDNFYPEKIEYYDKSGSLRKTAERRKIEKVGDYWVSRELEVHDIKEDHRTEVILEEVKFDSGLKDSLFTQRYLKR